MTQTSGIAGISSGYIGFGGVRLGFGNKYPSIINLTFYLGTIGLTGTNLGKGVIGIGDFTLP